MKKTSLVALLVILSASLFAQIQNPVKWTFNSKKNSDGKYELHLMATLENGWHIYSQTTPDGGPVATAINFTKNPLLVINGTTKEDGKLEQHKDDMFGVDVKQFSNKIDFIQTIAVKSNVKTTAAGTIKFMVCNDKECLPPKTINFSIALE